MKMLAIITLIILISIGILVIYINIFLKEELKIKEMEENKEKKIQ